MQTHTGLAAEPTAALAAIFPTESWTGAAVFGAASLDEAASAGMEEDQPGEPPVDETDDSDMPDDDGEDEDPA
jgi:hypothetical protein